MTTMTSKDQSALVMAVLSAILDVEVETVGHENTNHIVDEIIAGRDPEKLFKRAEAGGQIDTDAAIKIIIYVATAVRALILFRNPSPQNSIIMVDSYLDSPQLSKYLENLERSKLQKLHTMVTVEMQRRSL